MEKITIIGAGPAGLTAAYELLSKSNNYDVTIIEATDKIGGISRTEEHNGNRMDMGGHRFFSKIPEVNEWWQKMMPMQGVASMDDQILNRPVHVEQSGPSPEKCDNVMLYRNRVSRIYFNKRFFDYPVSLKPQTILNMGLYTTFVAGCSYLKAMLFPREEKSLEDFYINRFGKKLYSMFFEHYTDNLWGRHPSNISPDWGAQRVKGLSIKEVVKDMVNKRFHRKVDHVETSLINEFKYPKLGPGQLWERVAEKIKEMGGHFIMNATVIKIERFGNNISSITYLKDNGRCEVRIWTDKVISSMPLKDLVSGLNNVPSNITKIAKELPYRDYITVGVLLPKLNLKNKTNLRTLGNIIPDDWIYVHDRNVKMGRIQIYNNWSPYLVKDPVNTVWIGLEYFCNEGDDMWKESDENFTRFAVLEMVKMGLIDHETAVLDSHIVHIKKAYPAYFDSYSKIGELRNYLNTIPNLYCIGRNGQHRYNNMDHSMCTAFEAVNNILCGRKDKENIWNVNTEQEYHEETPLINRPKTEDIKRKTA